jgi:Metallo-beta-lactamase superfamily
MHAATASSLWGRACYDAGGMGPSESGKGIAAMRRLALLALLLCAIFGLGSSAQAITGEKAELTKIADGVYAFIGKLNDANALVIVTTQGVVLVDTGNNPPETRLLQKLIGSVTSQPVRYVIISQNHGDHTGGAPLFSPPANVIAHERVFREWAKWKPFQIKAWRKRFAERSAALTDYLLTARQKVRNMMSRGLALADIQKRFNMSEYQGWDRDSHFPWTAETIYRELNGQGPQVVPVVEQTVRATISKIAEEGRFLTVTAESGQEVRLRISTDTDFEGIADRTGLRLGMKVTALYQVPQGANAALGYDVEELDAEP